MSATTCDVAVRIGHSTQVDLQLPADQPIGLVLVGAQRYLEMYLAEAGSPDELPGAASGWRLRTPIGTMLDNHRSLTDQHIVSGDPLELIAAPKGEEFKPRIENVSVAVARISEQLFAAATRRALRQTLGAFCAALLAAAMGFVLVLAYTRHSWLHTASACAPVAGIAIVAAANAKWIHRRLVADLCAIGLLVFAPATLALLVPPPWGATGPRLLVAAATITGLSIVGMLAGRYLTAYAVAATVGVFTVIAEIPALTTAIPGQRMLGVLIWLLVIVLSRVDLLAERLARLPIPAFPSGSGRYLGRPVGPAGSDALAPINAPPDPAALMAQTIRANHFMTGLLAGAGVVGTILTALLAASAPNSWAWTVLAAGIPIMFAYRTFHFAGLTNVVCLLCGTFGATLALAVTLAWHHSLWWGAIVTAGAAVLAAAAPSTIPSRSNPQTPLTRSVRVVSENLVCLAVVVAPIILLRVPQMVYNRSFQ